MENTVHTAGFETVVYILIVIGIWLFKTFKEQTKKSTNQSNQSHEPVVKNQTESIPWQEEDLSISLPENDDEFVATQAVVEKEKVKSKKHFLEGDYKKTKRPLKETVKITDQKKSKPVPRIFRSTGLKNAMVLKEVLDRKHF